MSGSLMNRTFYFMRYATLKTSCKALSITLHRKRYGLTLDTMKLSELQTGEKGIIVRVSGQGSFRKRIIELGFIKGKTVSRCAVTAPFKDPIE